MRQLIFTVIFFIYLSQGYAWNSVGHRLIAQIAVNQLDSKSKKKLEEYNRYLNKVYQPQGMVNASVWLDKVRANGADWFNRFHYVDWYFTEDNSELPVTQTINAIWAIKKAQKTLSSSRTHAFDKGEGLRILIHSVGDIHQPVHTVSKVSQKEPQGDRGGSQFFLGKNPIGKSLHAYWDRGGGFLTRKSHYSLKEIKKFAKEIESKYPCHIPSMNINPRDWARESFEIAINSAYNINAGAVPTSNYQQETQNISEKQIALAGCRLAAILKKVDLK